MDRIKAVNVEITYKGRISDQDYTYNCHITQPELVDLVLADLKCHGAKLEVLERNEHSLVLRETEGDFNFHSYYIKTGQLAPVGED